MVIVIEKFDNEKKCRNFNGAPVIITKYIFFKFVHSISELLQCNNVITSLCLEGLPLSMQYVQMVAKVLKSFSNSFIIYKNIFKWDKKIEVTSPVTTTPQPV